MIKYHNYINLTYHIDDKGTWVYLAICKYQKETVKHFKTERDEVYYIQALPINKKKNRLLQRNTSQGKLKISSPSN